MGLPSFYGAWLVVFFGITQHAGLREDVLDHRLNTRTVYINPVFRFLYLNMNYHVEHHIFPTVPYYNLPALHREIKAYLPPPRPSMFAAYREVSALCGNYGATPPGNSPCPISGTVPTFPKPNQRHGRPLLERGPLLRGGHCPRRRHGSRRDGPRPREFPRRGRSAAH